MNTLLLPLCSWLFAHMRMVLIALVLIFAALAVAVATHPPKEDITFFLPDDPVLQRQFHAFSLTPPARLIFIHLRATRPEHATLFTEATQQLRNALTPPLFTAVHPKPFQPHAPSLMRMIPSLMSQEDITRFTDAAQTSKLPARIDMLQQRLMGPESIVLKHFIPYDPLGMLAVILERVKESGLLGMSGAATSSGTGMAGGMALDEGLPGNNGLSRLFFVETPRNGMDSAQALEVANTLERIAASMPEGIHMHALSSHQHTAANVRTIQADIIRVVSASCAALLLIFCIWLRRVSAIPALALPCIALFGAWGVLAASGQTLSGITLGFGGVLLGIVVDYALHVHCAIQAGVPRLKAAATLIRPLGFSFLTTACAVSVMFFSVLPGMRQVGLFSLAGCGVGLILALFILPLLEKDTLPPDVPPKKTQDNTPQRGIRILPYVLFLCVIGVCIWTGRGLTLHGDLRSLGMRDPVLIKAEQDIAATWGKGFRQSAMLVASASSLETALTQADEALSIARKFFADNGYTQENTHIITPLPLIPSPAKQTASHARWHSFAREHTTAFANAFGPEGYARQIGFTAGAFAPFLQFLEDAPRPIDLHMLDTGGMDLLRALFLPEWHSPATSEGTNAGKRFAVLTLLPDDQALYNSLQRSLPEGVLFFSPTAIASHISEAIKNDFATMGLYALGAVSLCLFFALRSLPGFLLALVPSLAGSGALLLVFGLGKEPLNLFTVAALPLVIGLSAEYGIFMARHCGQADAPSTPRAVMLSGLTTLAGFGSLILANHPALYSLGITVGVGIGAAIPAALWILPYLARKQEQ